MSNLRKTKIIATLGPGSDYQIGELIDKGVNCFRLNCSHSSAESLTNYAQKVRAEAKKRDIFIPLLFDLQGPKIRFSGSVENQAIEVGQQVVFSGPLETFEPGILEVAFPGFIELASAQSEIVVGDGTPRFLVKEIDGGRIKAVATSPGVLGPKKGVNVTFTRNSQAAITAKDEEDLKTAVALEADFIALSFVRGAEDLLQLRQMLQEAKSSAGIIAKIEKIEAYQNLSEILAVSNGIMVARGDYGIEAGVAGVPLMQKDTIKKANQAGKLVITATQMLESMIISPMPTRAEAADVANAVLDGTSAVMLSGETAVGKFALEAVKNMDEIIRAAEVSESIYFDSHGYTPERGSQAVMHAAVGLARNTNAEALLIPTASGKSARTCSNWKPIQPIIALCHDKAVATKLGLEWGVYAFYIQEVSSVDELVALCINAAKDKAGLVAGKNVVLTSGASVGTSGQSNLISLKTVE